MESIILNLLNLTGEERAAFAVLAPQRFHPDGACLLYTSDAADE